MASTLERATVRERQELFERAHLHILNLLVFIQIYPHICTSAYLHIKQTWLKPRSLTFAKAVALNLPNGWANALRASNGILL